MDGVTILILIIAISLYKFAFREEKPKKKTFRRFSKHKRYRVDYK